MMGACATHKDVDIGIFIESNHECSARANRRCSQVAGGPQHGTHRFLGSRAGAGKFTYSSAFRNDQAGCTLQQRRGIRLLQLSARWNRFRDPDVICLQKPGGAGTGSSPLTVVVPIDHGHSYNSFRINDAGGAIPLLAK